MNHDHRNKMAERILAALDKQGVQVTQEQCAIAIASLDSSKEKQVKPTEPLRLNMDFVLEEAEKLGFDVSVYSSGKYSAGINFYSGEGTQRSRTRSCRQFSC